MSRQKDVLTTGEVAKLCKVAPRTVSKWFDSGQLQGYRIPGSKDRRIPMTGLIRFMKQHGMPIDGLETGLTRVLIVDSETELTQSIQESLSEQGNYDVEVANGAFAAGIGCEKFRPHVLLVDVHLQDIPAEQLVKLTQENPDLQITKVVAMSSRLTEGQAQQLLNKGFAGFIKKPFSISQVIEAIEDANAIVY